MPARCTAPPAAVCARAAGTFPAHFSACREAKRSVSQKVAPLAPGRSSLLAHRVGSLVKALCPPTQWPCIWNTHLRGPWGQRATQTVISSVHRGLHRGGRKSELLTLAFETLPEPNLQVHFLGSPQPFRDAVSACRLCLPWIQSQHPNCRLQRPAPRGATRLPGWSVAGTRPWPPVNAPSTAPQ